MRSSESQEEGPWIYSAANSRSRTRLPLPPLKQRHVADKKEAEQDAKKIRDLEQAELTQDKSGQKPTRSVMPQHADDVQDLVAQSAHWYTESWLF